MPPSALLENASLFIDFDGTLVDLADRPEAIVVDPALQDLLGRLGAAFPGRLAIVSGRSIEQLDHFLGPWTNGLAVAGSHGIERRWLGGPVEAPQRSCALDSAAAALRRFAETHPGAILEPKSYGVALHYRLAPAIEEQARHAVEALAAAHGLAHQHGKMMSEIKLARGGDKGTAVRAFMERPENRGARPVFLGDDLTDEPGFAAAADLGGAGILVGPDRATAARFGLPGVAAARAWLASAL